MKNVKLLILAMTAALALIAFAGAGTASATQLCKENTSPCPAGYELSTKVTLTGAAPELVLSRAGVNYNCGSSEMQFEIETKNPGGALKGQVTSLSVGTCGWIPYCEGAEAVHLPYAAELGATKGGDGTLTLTSGGGGNPAITLTGCHQFSGGPPIGNCTYGAGKLGFAFGGSSVPTNASITKAELAKEAGSAYCQPAFDLGVNYEVASPFTASTAESLIKTSGGGTFQKCSSGMSGILAGGISTFTLSKCEGWCTTGKVLNVPYGSEYSGGTMTIYNGGAGAPSWEFSNCTFGSVCKYSFDGATLSVSGGELVANKETLTKLASEKETFCPANTTWSANYSLQKYPLAVLP